MKGNRTIAKIRPTTAAISADGLSAPILTGTNKILITRTSFRIDSMEIEVGILTRSENLIEFEENLKTAKSIALKYYKIR